MSIKVLSFLGVFILSSVLPSLTSDAKADDHLSLFPEKITFIGEKDLFNRVISLEQTLYILGNENTTVTNVTLVASSLYCVNTSCSIPSDKFSYSENNFNVESGSVEEVIISLEISDQKDGIYEGYLFLLFDANRIEKIDLQLILIENSVLRQLLICLVVVTIIIFFSLTFWILFFHKWSKARNLMLSSFFGLIGIFLILLLSPFNESVNLALITTLFAPLIGYIISILNAKRDFRKKTNELSYEYRNKMGQDDSKIIREIMGELTVHFAYLIADDWPRPAKIPDGIWNKSDKVGIVSDIHTSFLARYYRYIPLYNQSVEMLLKLCKNRKDIQDTLVEDFEKLKETFLEVETLLHLTLLYDIGLIQQTFLETELVSFPLHMSELLKAQLMKFRIMKNIQKIDREVYSKENASKFTTKMGIEINKKLAEAEVALFLFQEKLKKIEKGTQLPSFFND